MKAKELPIYRDTFELMKLITQMTRNFPRDLKISLGERLRSDCLDIVINVYRANAARDGRRPIISAILETVQVVEMTIRLCCDLALISKNSTASWLSERTLSAVRPTAGKRRVSDFSGKHGQNAQGQGFARRANNLGLLPQGSACPGPAKRRKPVSRRF